MSKQSKFEGGDHRSFSRHGEAFDRDEAFSSIDFEHALDVVQALRPLVGPGTLRAIVALHDKEIDSPVHHYW